MGVVVEFLHCKEANTSEVSSGSCSERLANQLNMQAGIHKLANKYRVPIEKVFRGLKFEQKLLKYASY
jgi:hypothetical protein